METCDQEHHIPANTTTASATKAYKDFPNSGQYTK